MEQKTSTFRHNRKHNHAPCLTAVCGRAGKLVVSLGRAAPALAVAADSAASARFVAACSKPFDQPKDTARQEECLDLDEQSLTTFVELWKGKKDLLESTKMDFYET